MKIRLLVIACLVALATVVVASPASAQTQEGLVNVYIADNTVQIPIAVAANVCDVSVGVLARQLSLGDVDCTALGNATASRTGNGNGNGGSQSGLVNLWVEDNTIQVPVGIAANLCNISAAVLAQQFRGGDTSCDAEGNADADA